MDNDNQDFELSEAEKLHLSALRKNPLFANQMFSMTEEFQKEVEAGMNADEAESLLIDSLRKLGSSMMTQWADTTQSEQVDKLKKEQGLHIHSKKNWNGIPPSER